jgi:hypothetical protein
MASAVSEEQATAVPERIPARRAVGEPEEGHAVALRLNDGLEHRPEKWIAVFGKADAKTKG